MAERKVLADAHHSGKNLAARCDGGQFIGKGASRADKFHRGFVKTAHDGIVFDFFAKKESG